MELGADAEAVDPTLCSGGNLLVLQGALRKNQLGNLVAGDVYMVDSILIVRNNITDQSFTKSHKMCEKCENRVLRKEQAALSTRNIAGYEGVPQTGPKACGEEGQPRAFVGVS